MSVLLLEGLIFFLIELSCLTHLAHSCFLCQTKHFPCCLRVLSTVSNMLDVDGKVMCANIETRLCVDTKLMLCINVKQCCVQKHKQCSEEMESGSKLQHLFWPQSAIKFIS